MSSLTTPEAYSDLTQTTLSSSYTAGAGSMVVTSTSGFPTARQFHFFVADQITNLVKAIGKATAVSSTTYTVVMTTDANCSSGDFFVLSLCAGAMDQIRADMSSFGTLANLPTVAKAGDRYKQTDGPYDFIYSGSAWQAFYDGLPATLPPTTGWTSENESGYFPSPDFTGGYGTWVSGAVTGVGSAYRTAPTTPYKITLRMVHDASGVLGSLFQGGGPNVAGISGIALGFRDSGGKMMGFESDPFGVPGAQFYAIRRNSYSSVSAAEITINSNQAMYLIQHTQRGLIYQIENDGTNLNLYLGLEINHMKLFYTEVITAFLSDADNVFWGNTVSSGESEVILYDWTVAA
jgi:hypothetical protein